MSSEPNKPGDPSPAEPPREEMPPHDPAADREETAMEDLSQAGGQRAADSSPAEVGEHAPTGEDRSEAQAPQTGEEMSEEAGQEASEPAGEAREVEVEEDKAQEAESREVAAQEEDEDVQPIESLIEEQEDEEELEFHWYILKVQVNREDSIRDALIRRVKIEGLEELFKEIVVPTEDVAEFNKAGKRRIVKKKLYPGYIMVNMAINDDTWFLVRETPGIGDFTGSAGKPTPMEPNEVDRILARGKTEEGEEGHVKTSIPFKQGDQVRVKDGNFQGFEGDVDTIDEAHGRVTVMINIFGRPTPVELEHWQIEAV